MRVGGMSDGVRDSWRGVGRTVSEVRKGFGCTGIRGGVMEWKIHGNRVAVQR